MAGPGLLELPGPGDDPINSDNETRERVDDAHDVWVTEEQSYSLFTPSME